MTAFLTVIHVINCVLLVIVVLLQSSKGGGLAGAFGGGAATQAVFGGRGAGSFLSRATTVLAVIFMVTSLTLTIRGKRQVGTESVLRRALQGEGRTAVPTQGLPAPGAEEGAPPVQGAVPEEGAGDQGGTPPQVPAEE